MKGQMGFPICDFIRRVYLNVIRITAVAVIVPLLLGRCIPDTVSGALTSLAISFIWAAVSVFYVGCSGAERKEVLSIIFNRFRS
jgi:flagellar biosynthesis protein FliR